MANWGQLTDVERRDAVRDALAGAATSDLIAKFKIDESGAETFARSVRAGCYWFRSFLEETVANDEADADTGIDAAELSDAIRNNPTSLRRLSNLFDRSEDTVRAALKHLERRGYNIVERDGRAALDTHSVVVPQLKSVLEAPCMDIAIGAIADLHMGSRAQQITWLNLYAKTAYDEGVRHIFVAGDLVAGHGVYRGQEFDMWAHSAEEQRVALVRLLPRYDGLNWHVIGGNHDYSFLRANGYDVVRAAASERPDMHYYGYNSATVYLMDNVAIRLWHPKGGRAYALGYRLQRGIEQAALEELRVAAGSGLAPSLRLVLAGHLHTRVNLGEGGIEGFHCGCYEGQTELLKAMGVNSVVGGWILNLSLTKQGAINRMKQEFIGHQEIEGDWENYRGELGRDTHDQTAPIFEWRE